jgi:hypothetical protein
MLSRRSIAVAGKWLVPGRQIVYKPKDRPRVETGLNPGLNFLLLRTGFGTKWPWSIEAPGFRVIGSRADSYIVAGLWPSYHSTLQVDGLMHSRPTSDIGARGKRH